MEVSQSRIFVCTTKLVRRKDVRQPLTLPKTSHASQLPPSLPTQMIPESLDIERRHMAALTWDAMFKSRRAAILADGGGLVDSVAVWRPAEVGCSVPLLTVVITRVCRKSGISSVFRKNRLFIEKKMNDLGGTRPI